MIKANILWLRLYTRNRCPKADVRILSDLSPISTDVFLNIANVFFIFEHLIVGTSFNSPSFQSRNSVNHISCRERRTKD